MLTAAGTALSHWRDRPVPGFGGGIEVRRKLIVLLGVVALVALLPSAAAAKTTVPDVKALIPRAIDLVTAEYPEAVWYQAEGLTSDGQPSASADDLVSWQFIFGVPDTGGPLSAVVRYGPPPEEWGPVVGLPFQFYGAIAMRKAPSMTLKDAVKLLRRAGWDLPFEGVVLYQALVAEPVNPRYVFTLIGPLGVGWSIA
jgi:hypothetical protein